MHVTSAGLGSTTPTPASSPLVSPSPVVEGQPVEMIIMLMDEDPDTISIAKKIREDNPQAVRFRYNQVATDYFDPDIQEDYQETQSECLAKICGPNTNLVIIAKGRSGLQKIYGLSARDLVIQLEWQGLKECGQLEIKADYIGSGNYLEGVARDMGAKNIKFREIKGPTVSVADSTEPISKRLQWFYSTICNSQRVILNGCGLVISLANPISRWAITPWILQSRERQYYGPPTLEEHRAEQHNEEEMIRFVAYSIMGITAVVECTQYMFTKYYLSSKCNRLKIIEGKESRNHAT